MGTLVVVIVLGWIICVIVIVVVVFIITYDVAVVGIDAFASSVEAMVNYSFCSHWKEFHWVVLHSISWWIAVWLTGCHWSWWLLGASSTCIEFCMHVAMLWTVPHAGAVRMSALQLNKFKSTDTSVLAGVSWRPARLWVLVMGVPVAARAIMVCGESVSTST